MTDKPDAPGTRRGTIETARHGPLMCDLHPGVAAAWRCRKCTAILCADCPTETMVNAVNIRRCASCQAPLWLDPISDEEQNPNLFRELVLDLPIYPVRGDGRFVLATSLLPALLLFFSRDIMVADFVCGGYAGLYILAYAMAVLRTSWHGNRHPPPWPDLARFRSDVLLPAGYCILSTGFVFGPAFLLWRYLPSGWEILPTLAALAGAVFWPMAVLSLNVHGELSALEPRRLVISIARVARAYTFTTPAIVLLGVAEYWIIGGYQSVSFGPFMLSVVALMWLLIIQMRFLGLLYYAHREQLGWFDEAAMAQLRFK